MQTAALTLTSGVTITVTAWPYASFAACLADYRALLKAHREHAAFAEGSDLPEQVLLDRFLLANIHSGKDRAQVTAADYPELLEAVHALNRVETVVAKPLGLYQRLLQAEMTSLETPTAATSPG